MKVIKLFTAIIVLGGLLLPLDNSTKAAGELDMNITSLPSSIKTNDTFTATVACQNNTGASGETNILMQFATINSFYLNYDYVDLVDVRVNGSLIPNNQFANGSLTIDQFSYGQSVNNGSTLTVSARFKAKEDINTNTTVDFDAGCYASGANNYHSSLSQTISVTYDTDTAGAKPVYRFLHRQLKIHFYTISDSERLFVQSELGNIWQYEGQAYKAFDRDTTTTKPVHRFLHKNLKIHFYTASESEKNFVQANLGSIWQYEGIAYYAGENSTSNRSLHRFLHKSLKIHFYTASETEKAFVQTNISTIWQYEGQGMWVR